MSLLARFLHTVQALGALVYHVATLRFRPFHHLHERVGAVVAAAAAPQPQSPTATTDRVRVLTQNLWCHYPLSIVKPFAGAQPGWAFKARIDGFGEHVREAGYDVVLLQEVFLFKLGPFGTTANFEYAAAAMSRAGLRYYTDPLESMSPARWFGQNSGLVIFSRHPILASVSENMVTSEGNNTKGYVTATVRLGGTGPAVRFVCTHLDSRNDHSRRAQVVQLCDRLVSMHQQQPEVPSVVAGDFNVCPQVLGRGGYDDGGQYHHLATNVGRVGLRDLYSAQESEATQEEATLDHIFLALAGAGGAAPTGPAWRVVDRRIVTVANSAGLMVSDHRGVAAVLDLLPGTRS